MTVNIFMVALLVFLWIATVAFGLTAVVFLAASVYQVARRRDTEYAIIYGAVCLVMAVCCAGSLYVALAVGRGLL